MAVREYAKQNRSESNRSLPEQTHHARQDLMRYAREYARENPEAAALWCLGVGFVLGWKLKPW